MFHELNIILAQQSKAKHNFIKKFEFSHPKRAEQKYLKILVNCLKWLIIWLIVKNWFIV